jgi:hypothetical protein
MGCVGTTVQVMKREGQVILDSPQGKACGGEWIGFYQNLHTNSPKLVAQANENFEPRLGGGTRWIPLSVPVFKVNSKSVILSIILEEYRGHGARWDAREEDMETPINGIVRRVRVVEIKRSLKKIGTYLFYGRCDSPKWDPERFQWNSSTPLMSYIAELGRNMLRK